MSKNRTPKNLTRRKGRNCFMSNTKTITTGKLMFLYGCLKFLYIFGAILTFLSLLGLSFMHQNVFTFSLIIINRAIKKSGT